MAKKEKKKLKKSKQQTKITSSKRIDNRVIIRATNQQHQANWHPKCRTAIILRQSLSRNDITQQLQLIHLILKLFVFILSSFLKLIRLQFAMFFLLLLLLFIHPFVWACLTLYSFCLSFSCWTAIAVSILKLIVCFGFDCPQQHPILLLHIFQLWFNAALSCCCYLADRSECPVFCRFCPVSPLFTSH